MKNISKICLIISALILIFTLISCQNSHTDTSSDTAGDTDTGVSTDSENSPPLNTDEPIYNDGKLIITNADSIEFYPTYDLGNYFGNGFKTVYDDFEGKIEYEIMQDYDETVESTTFGADVDEKIFETHYIVVLKLPDNYPDKSGFFGIKKLRKAGSINAADVVYKTPYNMSDVEYHYVVVPKSHLESWDDEGIIEMMWEEIDYLNYTVNVEVESDFREVDGYTELLTKSQLETYISTNDLPVYASTLALVPYYLVCFSKGNVETISFVRPTYENDVVEVTRDISVSASKSERAYLSIIPVNINVNNVKEINVALREIKQDKSLIKDYSIADTEINQKTENLFPIFDGGAFYGLDFTGMEKSAYTVIDTFEELMQKTEFQIDKEEFENNCVIVLRLVGEKSDRIGFNKLTVTDSGIEITAHVSPYYKTIQSGYTDWIEEDLFNKYNENKIEYEYIVVPKSQITAINQKTGYVTVKYDLTFKEDSDNSYNDSEYEFYSIYFCDNDYVGIESGDVYHINSRFQFNDFVEKYDLKCDIYKNQEYVVVYLENYYIDNVVQRSLKEENGVLTFSHLVKESMEAKEEKTENYGNWFFFIHKKTNTSISKVKVEYVDINYTSCNVMPNNENVTVYDFYKMEMYSDNAPNWKHKLISDYQTLQDVFDSYNTDKETDKNSIEDIFDNGIFDENYVLALYITEPHSGKIKNTFYNARVNADKKLYLYAFESGIDGCDAIYEMLYFIVIPKTHITEDIKDVIVQKSSEIVYNGKFDRFEEIRVNVNDDSARLENSFAIINSYEEYESVFPDFEISKGVDFDNYFILAVNRECYLLYDGDYVNFQTTPNGIASITFMYEESALDLIGGYDFYILDLIVIPRNLLKYEITELYVRYVQNPNQEKHDQIQEA